MKNKVLKKAFQKEARVIVSTICFVVGSIISLLLSISISTYIYLLSIPLLALTVYLISLCYNQIKDSYNYELKDEKNFDDGHYKTYFKNKKEQVESEFNILKGERHGIYKEFYKNGKIKYESNYINGVQSGETKSYYNSGKIYRAFNLSNGEYEGETKEFYKNGDLKFICKDKKYTLYKKNNIICEIEYDYPFGTLFRAKAVWKNFRDDGTIEYELDFNFKDNNKVLKTVYTKGGDIYSKEKFGYKINEHLKYNLMNRYATQRMESGTISINTGMKGPPGISSRTVNIYPIESVEDIIDLKSTD